MASESTAVTPVTARSVPPAVRNAIVAVGVVVVLTAAAFGGAVFGPQLFGPPARSVTPRTHGRSKPPPVVDVLDPKGGGAQALPSVQPLERIGVDVRADNGEIHVIKISIAVELNSEVSYEEFKRYIPVGRDAAIRYLRSLPYETAVASTEFKTIQDELNTRISQAIGGDLVRRVLFTDFTVE